MKRLRARRGGQGKDSYPPGVYRSAVFHRSKDRHYPGSTLHAVQPHAKANTGRRRPGVAARSADSQQHSSWQVACRSRYHSCRSRVPTYRGGRVRGAIDRTRRATNAISEPNGFMARDSHNSAALICGSGCLPRSLEAARTMKHLPGGARGPDKPGTSP